MNEISTEINRLRQAKADIKTAIEGKGVAVGSGTLDTYASKIEKIYTGESPASLDFGQIGYTDGEPVLDLMQSSLDYSQSKLNEWNPENTSADMLYKDDKQLIYAPAIGTSKVTSMVHMYSGCIRLEEIPQLDTSKVTDMSYMFYDCDEIVEIPEMDTSKVTKMVSMFAGCKKLETIPLLDCSNVTDFFDPLNACFNLKNLGGFRGLKKSIRITHTYLTKTSVLNVFKELANLKTLGLSSETIQISADMRKQLTPAQLAIPVSKGWELI